jgi:hypothetical protein
MHSLIEHRIVALTRAKETAATARAFSMKNLNRRKRRSYRAALLPTRTNEKWMAKEMLPDPSLGHPQFPPVQKNLNANV